MQANVAGCISATLLAAGFAFPASSATIAVGAAVTPSGVAPELSSLVAPGVTPSPSSLRAAYGTFDINIALTGASPSQQAAFDAAETFWEKRILGYEDPLVASFIAANFPTLDITATLAPNDGVGGILGSAGSTTFVSATAGGPITRNQMVSVAGIMNFDTADLAALEANGTLGDVIRHEMAHVLGFSDFFWDFVGATDGSGFDNSYTGSFALAQYQREFDPTATFIPVEESGGPGTAYAHWDENLFGNHLSLFGNSANPELMTGFLEGPTYLSATTLASFDDLGYVTAVPAPLSAAFVLTGFAALGGVRSRKKARRAT
ncbi:leishmanolysin [Aliiruegeria haliotis]|uniref:Leishmanolysin n=1 Tax=Aliiruegeria haliotis TaxID=1280846 RepID=A0A2T0S019_9RHOB|nr:leishmanolysin-related zinc metalloendopeptidase [Aliiruegeria haliotis]PRY26777.1 leishmanolysin [Aliiruegeria haliotis]